MSGLAARAMVLTTISVLALAACVTPSEPTADPSAPAPTPTPTVAPIGPSSSFDLACGDLAPLSDVQSLVGPATPSPYGYAGAGPHQTWGAALLQDGAIACEWRPAGSLSADVLVVAVDDAASGFQRALSAYRDLPWSYQQYDLFDATLIRCSDDYARYGIECHWSVLAGDIWLSANFRHLPVAEVVIPQPRENPDTSRKPILAVGPGSATAELVSSMVASLQSSPRREVERTAGSPSLCESQVSAGEVAAVMGVDSTILTHYGPWPMEEMLGRLGTDTGGAMGAYAAERQGYVSCTFSSDQFSVGYEFAPHGAWALEHPADFGMSMAPLEGAAGAVGACVFGETSLCTAVVEREGNLVRVDLTGGQTEPTIEQAVDLLGLVLD